MIFFQAQKYNEIAQEKGRTVSSCSLNRDAYSMVRANFQYTVIRFNIIIEVKIMCCS